jgi:peroxiredoxin
MALKVGDIAPDFSVPAVLGQEKLRVALSEYRDKKNVVIAFYPLDWTPV